MGVDIERVPWRRGDTPQHLGGQLGWHQAAKPTSNQFWVFNGTTGLFAPRAIVAADIPSTITGINFLVGTASSDLSAEIAVGTTPGGELGGTWASPTVDATHSGSAHHAQAHDAADHTNRTRTIPLVAVQATGGGAPTFANDTHGTLGVGIALTPHIDFADGAALTIGFAPVHLPSDFASAMTLVFRMSSTAAGNNVNFEWIIATTADDDAATGLILSGAAGRAINATADKTTTFTSGTVTPVAGDTLHCGLLFDRTAGADTNTGTVSLWEAYLSYTADS